MKQETERQRPIGVFDSGVGGISTLASLTRLLPQEDFIYYGDTRNAPYGTKTTQQVIVCVDAVVEQLLQMKIKALVIACNTATGAAAAELRERLSLPVIGTEPALKPASLLRQNGEILVLGTPLTLNQPKFNRLMELYGQHAQKVPCPGLMELVEGEDFEGAAIYLRQLFAGFDLQRVDAVVLGCTHYVFLKEMIREMLLPSVEVLDGNEGIARQLKRVLTERQLLKAAAQGSVRFFSSSTEGESLAVMERLYCHACSAMQN